MLHGYLGPRDLRAAYGDPIVVGGTGGSGTRSVALILAAGGVRMGDRLNAESDAKYLAAFDWQHGREILAPMVGEPHEVGGAAGHAAHDRAFRRAVRAHIDAEHQPLHPGQRWGWKHPHSYLLIPYLRRHFPGLRFVHVVRDGRDMALSTNQRQTGRYGPLFDLSPVADPATSAAYWSSANLYASASGVALGDSYYALRLEDLCGDPLVQTLALLQWLGVLPSSATPDDVAWAADIVHSPSSLGRWHTDDPARVEAISAAAEPGLMRFGYVSVSG